MPKLEWDKTGERLYETGVREVVLYPYDDSTKSYPKGVAWNGCTAVNEKPTGGDPTDIYADDIKYLTLRAVEKFEAGIEAYMYPDEFKPCNGEAEPIKGIVIGQQVRTTFGLSYRTCIGNDVKFEEYGYKIHLIWGASVSPSERGYATINDSPEAASMSWDMTTDPVSVNGYKRTAYMCIDSTKVDATKLANLIAILHGSDPAEGESGTGTVARLPMPDEIIAMFTAEEEEEDPGTT